MNVSADHLRVESVEKVNRGPNYFVEKAGQASFSYLRRVAPRNALAKCLSIGSAEAAEHTNSTHGAGRSVQIDS